MTSNGLKGKIDKLWTDFWTGGITNPLTVIEQITYLFFCRMLDEAESNREKAAKKTGQPYKPLFFARDQQHLRWSALRHLTGEELLARVRDEVFPFLRSLDQVRNVNGDNDGAKIGLGALMKDAQLLVVKATLLKTAISAVDELDMGNTDAKGNLYEYLLSKLQTAGINGQFRTPRWIIQKMVEMLAPKPTDIIGDPACGTAGFLVASMEYLRRTHTTKGLEYEENGNIVYIGDQLAPYQQHIDTAMFRGFDFDQTMLRLSAMNMMLHGVAGQCIFYQDSLSETFAARYPKEAHDHFDIILAKPPFKGNLDTDDIAAELTRKVKTGKTELLFLVRMLGMLKLGGRCAVIVPDGVLFGSSKAHIALRQLLVDENQLDGVISLPSGVFRPYAGVSTAILLFTKGGKTDDVFFFDVQADGYSLDDKRNKIDADDLPELLERWQKKDPQKDTDRISKAFFVNVEEIREQKYDLSLNRYKEQVYEAEEYDPPLEILEHMEKLEEEILADVSELRGMLG